MNNIDGAFLVIVGGIIIVALVILVIIEALPKTGDLQPLPDPIEPSQYSIGGCAGTRWGCCADGTTPRSDPLGTNCGQPPAPIPPPHHLIGGCAGTRWGCCSDGETAKTGPWDTC